MSSEDLYVEVARQKAEIAKLQSRMEALENIVYHKKTADKALDFNPEHLTKHVWKGKKLGHRRWAEGSLVWGWDFIAEFPEQVIDVLVEGPLTIGESIFTLGDKTVSVKKVDAK